MGKRGFQPWQPSEEERRLVEHYVSLGYTQDQIADLMGKSIDSLDRHCRRELDLGKLKVNAKVGGKLFQKCMAGDTAALIFWAKTQMGWKETHRVEGEINGRQTITFDPASLPATLQFLAGDGSSTEDLPRPDAGEVVH